jgi:hypothetical protein
MIDRPRATDAQRHDPLPLGQIPFEFGNTPGDPLHHCPWTLVRIRGHSMIGYNLILGIDQTQSDFRRS